MFKELKVRHKFVSSGNRIEKVNQDFQRTWYRLMRLGRGDLEELDQQAAAITNNLKSKVTGYTPLEALDIEDVDDASSDISEMDVNIPPKWESLHPEPKSSNNITYALLALLILGLFVVYF